jgi:hypothetical protein
MKQQWIDCYTAFQNSIVSNVSGVKIVSVNKPLRAVAMPFLMTSSNRVAYINEWAWSGSMQMALVAVYIDGWCRACARWWLGQPR